MRLQRYMAPVVSFVVTTVCVVTVPALAQDCPELVGSYVTPAWAHGVAVSGGYAYVADDIAGLRVIDVSDPSALEEVGFCDTPTQAQDVAVAGGYAYVADGITGLRVIAVSDPSAPEEVGFWDTPGEAVDVAVASGYAYVADGAAGLRVIDVSDPSAPEEVGHYGLGISVHGVAVQGSYAYIVEGSGGSVVKVSNPSSPVYVGDLGMSGPGVAVSGGHAYVLQVLGNMGIFGRLWSINVTTPSEPFLEGMLPFFGGMWSFPLAVAVSGDYAFVVGPAYSGGGLQVIDVSNPAEPEEVGFGETPGYPQDVAVAGPYVYVAEGLGLSVLTSCTPLVFQDSFESGDTSAWTATVP